VDAKIDVPALMAWASTVPPETLAATGPLPVKALESNALGSAGVVTAADVLALDHATAAYATTGVNNLAESIDRARATKVGKVFLNRGVSSVSVNRSVYEQDVDIEDSQGYVYLIGVRTTGRKRDTGRTATERLREKERFEYDAFVNWDKSAEGECQVFVQFWSHIQACREKAKRRQFAYRLYYYTSHEVTAFKALAERHAGQPGVPTVTEVEEFFALKEVIDLHKVLSTELVWPTASVKLKEVAKWVRFSWRDSDPGGGNSLAWYDDAVDHADEAVREENRVRLLEYNEDDVTAQVALRDWLSRLGEARHPGKKLPSISTLDRRFGRR
jgi:predicted RecB family nuclease